MSSESNLYSIYRQLDWIKMFTGMFVIYFFMGLWVIIDISKDIHQITNSLKGINHAISQRKSS
jgi:hypothetical protein